MVKQLTCWTGSDLRAKGGGTVQKGVTIGGQFEAGKKSYGR